MDLKIGSIFEGKVTGITKFGAFVMLPVGKSGMVHISEIANTYVDDIKNYLTEGQTVTVKLIGIDDAGRINLSIKKALPEQQKQPGGPRRPAVPAPVPVRSTLQKSEDNSFEDKLKLFMQSSESRISDLKSSSDRRSGGRKRK